MTTTLPQNLCNMSGYPDESVGIPNSPDKSPKVVLYISMVFLSSVDYSSTERRIVNTLHFVPLNVYAIHLQTERFELYDLI